jgi:ubiquinone biosynthesis protein Coq4
MTQRGDLNTIFDLEDGFQKTIWMTNCIERLKQDPASTEMLEERYIGPDYFF